MLGNHASRRKAVNAVAVQQARIPALGDVHHLERVDHVLVIVVGGEAHVAGEKVGVVMLREVLVNGAQLGRS